MGWRRPDVGSPGGPTVDINTGTHGQLDEDRVSADAVIAGEPLTQGDPIYLDSATNKWKKSNAALIATMPARAVATQAAVLDASFIPAFSEQKAGGYVFVVGDRGKNVYVASGGGITLTPTATSGEQLQRIGFVFSTSEIRVLIDELPISIQ